MNKNILIICLLVIATLTGCKKDEFNFLSQNHPDVPVTVTNLFGMYNGVPTVSTSLSGGGTITINLSIPANKGRTIKEITRVAIASTPTNYKVVQVSTGLYNTAPIAGDGTSVTFTTSLAEYTSKTGINVTASGTATSFLSRYFYFLITLDNGDQLIPVPVRVYVAS
ncbi:MAG: hypothetical protein HYR66_13410 [Sphingobacteriales bacterium]|nr:hypothetical protein [Sphingobacteriales bacterium]MBI3717665.1 hypothetical protein [Sphingobacteriales bacterium]